MTIWSYWEEISRVMAVLCLITAGAAIVAAGILVLREELGGRLRSTLKSEAGKRKGILLLAAAGVWVLVIGKSVSAAEVPVAENGANAASSSEAAEPAQQAGAAGTNETAPVEEPGSEEDPPVPDEKVPVVSIQMTEETKEDAEGRIYCRQDNAGIRVRFTDDRMGDTGIISYYIVIEDVQGRQIRREYRADAAAEAGGESEAPSGEAEGEENQEAPSGEASLGIAVGTEEIAELADGMIHVSAVAADAAGNEGEAQLDFVLDTKSPVITEIRSFSCEGEQETEVPAKTLYDGTDLYYNDKRQITRVKIEDAGPVSWCMEYCFQAGEGENSPATRQITGQRTEAAASISAEGTYSDWMISGEDLAGNPLLLSSECKCTQDAEGAVLTDKGIALARRKILDRTAPAGEICYRSDAKGFRYLESGSTQITEEGSGGTQTATGGSGEIQTAAEGSGEDKVLAAYYFGGNIEVSLVVSDKCADAEMPVEPGQFKLLRKENGAGVVYEEETFLVEEDGTVQFGAYGRDRAGNALVVREVFLSAVEDGMTGAGGTDSSGIGKNEEKEETEQADEQSCSFGSVIVRDTVCPVAQASINRPIGNPAGIDADKDIVYFGRDSGQYGGGVPAITVSLRVNDANLEPGRIEMRTAFSEVPGGKCCEEVMPDLGEAVREECEVRRGSAGEGSEGAEEGHPEELLMTVRKFPGREGTPDGVYRFGFAGTDKAGNPLVFAESGDSEGSGRDAGGGDAEDELRGFVCVNAREGAFMSGRKVVDTAAPRGEIGIANEEGEVYCRMSSHDRRWASEGDGFMPFRREREAVIEYRASDSSPVSASCRLLSTAGERNEAPPSADKFQGGCEGEIRIYGGQIFRIENWVLRDRAGNVSAPLKRTVDFYLDTQLPEVDIDAPVAVVRAAAPISSRTADGRGLYNGAVNLEILAVDPDREHGGSGLREVYCEVKISGRTVKEEALFLGEEAPAGPFGEYDPAESAEGAPTRPISEKDPAESADGRSAGSIDKGDSAADPVESGPAKWTDGGNYAPVYRFRTEIRLPAGGEWESDDIEVTVVATDNAGNRSDPGDGGRLMLGIDSTAPVVHVTYDNNEVRNGHYFDRARKATIEVRERNFDPGKLFVTAPGAVQGEWKRRAGSDQWAREVRFAADGEYTLEVSGTDAVGNAVAVTYAGEAPQAFVIDRIPPQIEVIWDNEDVRNGMYYNRPRCATVRITDLSPDERAVQIFPYARALRKVSQEADGRTAGPVSVYEAQVPFTEEGEWSLHCACTDLAGNIAVPVHEGPFVIDMTAPRLCFDSDSVQETGAYGSAVSPVLLCEDQNIAPGSLYAVWRNLTAGGALMECRGGAPGDDEEEDAVIVPDLPEDRAADAVNLPNLPEDKEADGICVLFGTACDLAGNRSRIRRNLSVNRFGSVYDFSEDAGTMEIVNSYYTDAQSPFVIAEYNVSPVKSRKITLYRNSGARVLEEGSDYVVSQEKSGKGMKYVCEIRASAFQEEGKYSILIESEDEAGNLSRSPGRFRGGPGYSPTWAVDRTPPQVRLAGEDADGRRFVADSLVLNLVPSDNMELKELEILITDEKDAVIEKKVMGRQELDEIMGKNSGQVPVTIRAGEGWQTLRAVAIDGAGNRSSGLAGVGDKEVGDSCRVLVSENLMVHLYRSGLLPAAAFLALLSAIWFAYGVYKRTLA